MAAPITLKNESTLGWAKAEGADFVRMLFQPHGKGFNYAFLLSQTQNFKPH